MTEEIRFFIHEEPYGFLSNFERTPITIDVRWGRVTYPTNEHYYQSQKANNEEIHDWIAFAPHAKLAMIMGRQLEHNKHLNEKFMVPDWDSQKVNIMLNGLRKKFEDEKLRQMLLDTGDAVLHEDNPDDFYWAIADGTGQSMLGKCLMQVRDEIRASIDSDIKRINSPEESVIDES